ncbi:methyl-accepting chemotaxis protein [Kosakonia radicincitans DSM 16656]|uniref:Methyl-accepting chemotaxis protein-2, aspartate sensor receptor n=1 Tax=Kosakonia radicincitans TaxID=283686 RepID=A0AAX2EN68_9ENTR|nr:MULTISPECIES: methyl-accepting chemotaxis protein [Kosakonia]MDP9564453.1 methyl-accepting chemotaxis protein-2 (aspartate sensor receptor) [Kosakonia oryzae]ARD61544.1 methyl-accepting chemotaxis protein [Kosakonia radicincitans DSM 16656]MDD7998310.1 methyl-accepting chemotaxis protein [Kosakonia radicincitans]NCF04160.1 HAMP domain-containing protein [Kosakonia sp. MH5]PTA93163.1 HAMP domain-containing protein [Kosakonia sp. H7A]
MKNKATIVKPTGISIRNKIIFSFGILIVLLAFIAGNALYRLDEAKNKISKIVTEDYPTTAMGNNLIREVNTSTILFLNALIEKNPQKQSQLMQEVTSRSEKINELYKQLNTAADDAASQAILANVTDMRKLYIQSRNKVIQNIQSDPVSAIDEYTNNTREKELQYIDKINTFINLQRDEMQSSYTDFLHDYSTSKMVMIIIAIVCLILGATMAIIISRAIVIPIKHAVEAATRIAAGNLGEEIKVTSKDETGQLTSAISHMQDELIKIVTEIRGGAENIATGASQIMAGTRDLSARTEEQASSIEQTASSMEQISATVKNTGDNTANASQLSARASNAVTDNGKLMASLTQEIQNISNSADKMSDIINLIDSIAFQTNILALNAAVEAARAGEHGKGFAVVAQEVRNLAQKTANSSKEIRTLIENSTQQSVRGLEMVRQVNGKMDELVQNVDSVTSILKEIEQASLEQSDGVHQINIAIGQIDTTTQQNAALVEESVAASEMLNEQARVMQDLVSVFRIPQHA